MKAFQSSKPGLSLVVIAALLGSTAHADDDASAPRVEATVIPSASAERVTSEDTAALDGPQVAAVGAAVGTALGVAGLAGALALTREVASVGANDAAGIWVIGGLLLPACGAAAGATAGSRAAGVDDSEMGEAVGGALVGAGAGFSVGAVAAAPVIAFGVVRSVMSGPRGWFDDALVATIVGLPTTGAILGAAVGTNIAMRVE